MLIVGETGFVKKGAIGRSAARPQLFGRAVASVFPSEPRRPGHAHKGAAATNTARTSHYQNTESGFHNDSLLEYLSGEKKTVLARHVHNGRLIDALTN